MRSWQLGVGTHKSVSQFADVRLHRRIGMLVGSIHQASGCRAEHADLPCSSVCGEPELRGDSADVSVHQLGRLGRLPKCGDLDEHLLERNTVRILIWRRRPRLCPKAKRRLPNTDKLQQSFALLILATLVRIPAPARLYKHRALGTISL